MFVLFSKRSEIPQTEHFSRVYESRESVQSGAQLTREDTMSEVKQPLRREQRFSVEGKERALLFIAAPEGW